MLIFTGDLNITDWIFNVGFGVGTKIGKGYNPFLDIKRGENEIWVGNFEGVSSIKSVNKGINAKAFRVAPNIIRKLHHLDYYGLANNHAMEHGKEAFMETVESLEDCGSKVFGLRNKRSCIFEHEGKIISITGMCLRIEATKYTPLYWHNPEYRDIEKEIACLPKDAFKVLFVHWGNEYINRPSSQQKKFAHWLIDAGYDLVIGMHPHVLQGYEDYAGKRIYYSLGNFVFDMPSEQCRTGAIVRLNFVNGCPLYSEQYLNIDSKGFPHVVSEDDVPAIWHFSFLNERLKIEDNSEEYHKDVYSGYLKYRRANRIKLLASAFTHPVPFCGVLMDFIKRKI